MNINHKTVYRRDYILEAARLKPLFLLAFILLNLLLTGVIQAQENLTILKIHDPDAVCHPATVDLTLPEITAGSTERLILSYFTDTELKIAMADPKKAGTGTYYIKGTSPNNRNIWVAGSVKVIVNARPVMTIEDSIVKGVDERIDLTSPAIKQGSEEGLIYSYWLDPGATKPLPLPESAGPGTFFIMGTTDKGCSDIQSITIKDR